VRVGPPSCAQAYQSQGPESQGGAGFHSAGLYCILSGVAGVLGIGESRMQFSLNFRTVVVLVIVGAVGYYVYQEVFGGLVTNDVAKLMTLHRRSEPAQQTLIKHRIMTVYNSSRDYDTVVRALDSASLTTQALAVAILAEKVERRAVPRLLKMLDDPNRPGLVKEALANAAGTLGIQEAIPRLVELTDKAEEPAVRASAHNALVRLTGAGAQVKFGDAAREQWNMWLRTQRSAGVR